MKIEILGVFLFCSFFILSWKSDIDSLKGKWVDAEANLEEQPPLYGLLGPPTLEILDEENCNFSFLGINGVGKMNINQETKKINVKWNKRDLAFEYVVGDNSQVFLLYKKGKIELKKTTSIPKLKEEAVGHYKMSKQFLIGEWEISSSNNDLTYSFDDDYQVEIKFLNGDKANGFFMLNGKDEVSIVVDKQLTKYTCELYSNSEMKLTDKKLNVPITLKRKGSSTKASVKKNKSHIFSKSSGNRHEKEFNKFHIELNNNYDKYINVIHSRTNRSKKAFNKIEEDLKFLKESQSLAEFIEVCPRIDNSTIEIYFEGLNLVLGSIRKESNQINHN